MDSRGSLHRTQQWQLAERQRYLSELESLGERLAADLDRLRAEIDNAGGDGAARPNQRLDPLFVRPLIDRRDKLIRSIGEIDTQIAEAREALASARQEAKLIGGGLVHHGLRFEERLTRRTRRSL
jgi:hypothetical protein